MRNRLFDFLAEQRRFVYLAVAILTAAGIWTAFNLPSAIYPELTFSRITVVVEGSSLGARQVLFSITRPLEEAAHGRQTRWGENNQFPGRDHVLHANE